MHGFYAKYNVAGIMPIITCPSCNLINTRLCREKGFVENTRLFGFVWCRLLRRFLGFDSDFAQISGQSASETSDIYMYNGFEYVERKK